MPKKKLSSEEIRSEFLRYFETRGHRVCSSYPLVPPNDPTLLFTNAGMVQFKDVFTGKEHRDFSRATSSQKCVRAGGKHNDLENVGRTARHHTFFEMLGNFSFGDYFKKEAVQCGWEFLVDWMGLEENRLWVTVFEGDREENLPADDEAADLWHNVVGVPRDRILRFGKKDNFWAMGDTGPCGPCSEIHYDQGDAVACDQPGNCQGVACECDRYLEVWNLVFMQFNRDTKGALSPLPAPSIDTGMGLERLCAIIQGAHRNYDTDLFLPLLHHMAGIAGGSYGKKPDVDVSLRVVADHARATAFLMSDGVLPSNEGRGYVLRRIMRRAIRHGHKLGVEELFFHRICLDVVELMEGIYPELGEQKDLIEKATRLEEETFRRTLGNGLRILKKEIEAIERSRTAALPGKLVFDLQTRDGFPPDLTAVIAGEHGLELDWEAYRQAWEHHQEVSAGGLGLEGVDDVYRDIAGRVGKTDFCGYAQTEDQGEVLALLALEEDKQPDGRVRIASRQPVEAVSQGQLLEAVISPTPFYGETGGQLGDTGTVSRDGFAGDVLDATRPLPDLIVHRVRVTRGTLRTGDRVQLQVNRERRQAIRRNHSATHLLQAALRQVLGKHVNQKGSLVAPERLRFDFSHFAPMTREESTEVERVVNRLILANHPVEVTLTDIDGARAAGATMLFGEKYDQQVRMVRMGESLELCGGTHTDRTGDIGVFKILAEGGIQAGVRRIEAVTGEEAFRRYQLLDEQLDQAARILKAPAAELLERLKTLGERERKLTREVEQLQQRLAASGDTGDPTHGAREIGGVRVLALPTSGIKMGGLRDFADRMRDKLGGGIVLAFAEERGKLAAVCSVSKELTNRVKAGDLLRGILELTGGKGGGRPDFAQGGGGDPDKLEQAIEAFYPLVEKSLEARP